MRLAKIQDFLRRHGVSFRYLEENGCGSIEFSHRGLNYYIWEYPPIRTRGTEQCTLCRPAGRLR